MTMTGACSADAAFARHVPRELSCTCSGAVSTARTRTLQAARTSTCVDRGADQQQHKPSARQAQITLAYSVVSAYLWCIYNHT